MNAKRILRAALLTAFVAAGAMAQEDYTTWAHMKVLTLSTSSTGGGAGVAGTVTGFPVLVRLTSAQADVFAQSKTGGADLRFRRLPGPSLPYQIERWDSAGQSADIWVRLDSVRGNASQAFNMYWGKSSAPAASNGAATFDTAGGYQGVWHFAASLNDATANAIHGTNDGTFDDAGAIGRGRSFDGSSRVLLGNPPKMSSGDADRFTVEAWVNWTAIGTSQADRYRCIINHGTTTKPTKFGSVLRPATKSRRSPTPVESMKRNSGHSDS
jgi:hypothetical protein